MSLLSDRQKEELHRALLVYCESELPQTATALREEAEVGQIEDHKKYEALLEKKWLSVIRLQKKIMDLETKVNMLQVELDSTSPISRGTADPSTWLPKLARHTLTSHRLPVTSIAFHPTFTVLASGSEDSTVKLWDWETGDFEMTLKGHTKAVLDVDFGGPPSSILLASCSSDLTIKLWYPSLQYQNTRTLYGHDHTVSSIRFTPSGEHLLSASRDKVIRVWDTSSSYCIRSIMGHSDWIRALSPSPDGSLVLSVSSDKTARICSIQTGDTKLAIDAHDHVVECCIWAPRSSYVHLAALGGLTRPPTGSCEYFASGGRDKLVKIWDQRGSCVRSLAGHGNWIRALAFHPSGKYLLSASDDKSIRCWDLTQDARCVKIMEDAHEHFVTCLRWAPSVATTAVGTSLNGEQKTEPKIRCVVATGSVDTRVKIWMG